MTERELKKACREELLRLLIENAKELERTKKELDEKSDGIRIYMDLSKRLQDELEEKENELKKQKEKSAGQEKRIDDLTDVLMMEYAAAKGRC